MERKAKGMSTFTMKSPLKSYKDKTRVKYKDKEWRIGVDYDPLNAHNYTAEQKKNWPKY